MDKTNNSLLRLRMERNYAEYRHKTLALCNECLFESAAEIAAYREVYSYVTARDWTSEEIAGILLLLDNPLAAIVNEWQDFTLENSAGFDTFAYEMKLDYLVNGSLPSGMDGFVDYDNEGYFDDDYDYFDFGDDDDDCADDGEAEGLGATTSEPPEDGDMAFLSEILTVCEKHLQVKAKKLLEFDEDGFFIYEDEGV